MKVAELVEKYNKLSSKELKLKLIEDRIVNYYVSIGLKMVTAKGIAENVAKEKDGCYVHNSPQRFLSYVISSLMLYTDLELTGENNIEVYDTLQEYGLVDVIMELIGTDGVEYQTIRSEERRGGKEC